MLEVRSLTTDLGQIYSLFHSSRVNERSTKHAQVSKLRGFYDKLTTGLTHMPYRTPQAKVRERGKGTLQARSEGPSLAHPGEVLYTYICILFLGVWFLVKFLEQFYLCYKEAKEY